MRLDQLIDGLPLTLRSGDARTVLSDLTDDSRQVKSGSLFIGRLGAHGRVQTLPGYADTMRYVPAALEAGAVAVLLPRMKASEMERFKAPEGVAVCFADADTAIDQRLCGQLAERYFGQPSKQLKLIGVTGTNGKTTTVTITKHLLESAGHKCGLIGTVELDTGGPDGPRPATLTTPGAIELSRLLAEMVANGCAYCVMEVSSHALHQGRADHLRFAVAAFTNLTQDHLDYHGTMQAYADAKAILFEGLDEDAVAVINAEDPYAHRMMQSCGARLMATAVLPGQCKPEVLESESERCAVEAKQMLASGSEAVFAGPWGDFDAKLSTPGKHNLSNALQAAALGHAAGLDNTRLCEGIQSCRPVPGRLEPVGPDWPATSDQPPATNRTTVLVDYAHTPDALQNVGKALHELTKGRLITLFGCGGDRDRAKRPLMAQAAQQYADVVVLTSDNPRTEDPQQILDDASAGFAPATSQQSPATHTIPDRAEAIRFAVGLALPEDTVLIAGKGHEDYQIIGTEKVHFDDREQAAAALREKLNA